MKKISQSVNVPPDILEGATIVTMYGGQSALVENYKSIIEFTPSHIKLQGKHIRLLFEGMNLQIDHFTRDDCKICGNIQEVHYIPM